MARRTSSESSKDSKSSRTRSERRRDVGAVRKTEIRINVYDLLPPGKLSTILWTIGSGLLHSGVVIGSREYAYGGHDRRGLTGVYYTKPQQLPPGGTFRTEILHGFTFRTPEELDEVIREASDAFSGTSYNLLTKNCNHFTSYLCERLTGKPAPRWLNRAAGIGVALPCVVPRDWIAPPEYDTMDGELVDDEEDYDYDEQTRMLRRDQEQRLQRKASDAEQQEWNAEIDRMSRGSVSSGESYNAATRADRRERYMDEEDDPPARPVKLKDSSGRAMPPAERAPLPRSR